MTGRHNARASLFLMELIFTILFFALGSAVCVQAFAHAHAASRRARELAFASAAVASAAETLRCTDGSLAAFAECFPTAYEEDGALAVAYDAGLCPCAPEQGCYWLRAVTADAGGVCHAELSVTGQAGQTVYALSLRWPARQTGGAA